MLKSYFKSSELTIKLKRYIDRLCNKIYTITATIEEAEHGKGAYAKAQALKKDPPNADKVE